MTQQTAQGIQYGLNVLFLLIYWKQQSKVYQNEEDYEGSMSLFYKFFKQVREATWRTEEGQRQFRLEIMKTIFPFIGWLVISEILVNYTGGNVFWSTLSNIGLILIIGLPILMLVLLLRKNQIYPENKLCIWIFRRPIIKAIQKDLFTRLEEAAYKYSSSERKELEDEKKFLDFNYGYSFVERFRHISFWRDPVEESAALWGLYLNNAEIIIEALGDIWNKKTDEEKHAEFLRSKRISRNMFFVVVFLTFLPLLTKILG